MSEHELAALLARYESREDEFAHLVRGLVANIREARADADLWQENYNTLKDRLFRVAAVAEGRTT